MRAPLRSFLGLVILLGGCGGSSDAGGVNSGSGAGSPSGAGSGTSTANGNPGAGGSTSSSGACTTATDCSGGMVCDPATGTCVDDSPCTTHADCPAGSFCEAGNCEPNQPGGACATDANCAPGETCTGGICGCGGHLYSADATPPNVLIALDRSASMVIDDPIDGQTKWEIAVDAIGSILSTSSDNVRWGLKLWPGDPDCQSNPDCSEGHVYVDVGPGTAAEINSTLAQTNDWCYGTPITNAVQSIKDYPGLEDTTRANYVLLITDGKQQFCDGVEVDAVTALRNESPEIKTFVIGFGGEVDPATLDAMAVAGGTDRPGDPKYYQADTAAELTAALAAIAGKVLSCAYTLDAAPPDADQLYVYFDGVLVPRDPSHAAGWDYQAGSLQMSFYGADCLSLQQGLVTDLVISYGCPESQSTSTGTGSGPGSGAGGGDSGGSGAGGGGCVPSPGACTSAADCCGGLDCIGGICSTPVPK